MSVREKKQKKTSRDRKNENQKARKMEQWGTGMGKKSEQHEKVVNNFMQIKGEQ